MKENISKIISKFSYCAPLDQIPLDFRINPHVFSAESQLPDLHLKSKTPFDKNLCFYNINLSPELKENIFPKEVYNIPNITEMSKCIKKIETVNLDELFGNVKLISVDVFDKDFNLDDIEQSLVKSSIKRIIQENKIVPFESKIKNNNQWYIIGHKSYGPYRDDEMFQLLTKSEKDERYKSIKSNLMVWEKNNDIFYTVDVCIEKLKEIIKEKNDIREDNRILMKGNYRRFSLNEMNNDFSSIMEVIGEKDENYNVHMREMDSNVRKGEFKEKLKKKNEEGYEGNNSAFKRRNNKYKTWTNGPEETGQKGFNKKNLHSNYFKKHSLKGEVKKDCEEGKDDVKGKENKEKDNKKILKMIDITESVFS